MSSAGSALRFVYFTLQVASHRTIDTYFCVMWPPLFIMYCDCDVVCDGIEIFLCLKVYAVDDDIAILWEVCPDFPQIPDK